MMYNINLNIKIQFITYKIALYNEYFMDFFKGLRIFIKLALAKCVQQGLFMSLKMEISPKMI